MLDIPWPGHIKIFMVRHKIMDLCIFSLFGRAVERPGLIGISRKINYFSYVIIIIISHIVP